MNRAPFSTPEFAQAIAQRAGAGALHAPQSTHASTTHDRFVVNRGANMTGTQFADFVVSTRRAMTQLDSGHTGHQMLAQTNQRLSAAHGNVFITHSAGVNDAADNFGAARYQNPANAMFRQANGARGAGGIGTTVNWNPENRDVNGVGRPSFIGLGHELVHAWRNAHGATLHRRPAADMFNPLLLNQFPNLRRDRHAAVGMDEGQTVGLSRLIHEWMPSENALRAEHGVQARRSYGDYWVNGIRHF